MIEHSAKHIAEYLGLRGVAAIVRILPYRAALCVGWLLAALAYGLGRKRVNTAKARIRQVFGSKYTEREISAIAWHSLRNICFDAIEILMLPRMTLEWIRKHADCKECMARLLHHHEAGKKGAIVACCHMGSWELAGVASHLHGVPIFTLAARQKNPLTDAYLNELRRSPGIETLARGSGVMRDILRMLKAGKFLAILPDVRKPTPGVKINFLGGEANLAEGMAMFARHADVPVFPAIVTRKGWANHKIQSFAPIWPDQRLEKDADARRITEAVMRVIEDAIRADPGQWFWYNKRWILDPLDAPAPDERMSLP